TIVATTGGWFMWQSYGTPLTGCVFRVRGPSWSALRQAQDERNCLATTGGWFIASCYGTRACRTAHRRPADAGLLWSARGALAAVDHALELGGRGEARHLARRHVQRLAGARVARRARLARGLRELAEARVRHVVAGLHAVLHDVAEGVQHA